MDKEILSFIYNVIAGTIIIGFGLVLLFVSNNIKNIVRFRIAKNLLAIYMIIVGASFYLAYASGKYSSAEKIETLNFSSILIYFIATSFLSAAFIFLFDLRESINIRKLRNRIILPLTLITCYIITAVIYGDYSVYSFRELIEEIPNHPILLFRLIVFVVELEFFVFLIHKLRLITIYNKKKLTKICSNNDYISIESEKKFIIGSAVLFITMMLHYLVPSMIVDLITSTSLVMCNLLYTVLMLNYQTIYQRLNAMVKFVDGPLEYSSEAASTPVKTIRYKIEEFCNELCNNIGSKELSLTNISNEIGINSVQLYEFIKYEYGINYDQWIKQLRIRCLCNNINKCSNKEELAEVTGFFDVEKMETAFLEIKHLSIDRFKSLNFENYEITNNENQFYVWIYDPNNRNIKIIMNDNSHEELISIDDVKDKLGDGRSEILNKIAKDADAGLFESRSCQYTISNSSEYDGKRYIEAKCIPLVINEDRKPLIVGLECDKTYSHLMQSNLTKLISILDKEKSQAIVSLDKRTALLENISHDIRSPLSTVVSFSELLQYAESDKEKNEYSNIISSCAESLLKLINDLLDLSKLEAGHIQFTMEDFDINTIFNETYFTLASENDNAEIDFKKTLPYNRYIINYDRVRLHQILTNFYSNAIKFTKKGSIEMGYEIIDNNIKLYVKDTGCGIPESKHNKVFSRYQRFNKSEPGTGLGLSICKAIAESSGGKVGFDSKENEGSTFWAIIPANNIENN